MGTVAEAEVYALVAGRVVAHLRQGRGWSQQDLARAVGLTQPTLSRIERGQGLPDVHVARRIALAFGMTTADLVARVDDAFARTEQVARAQLRPDAQKKRPWWQGALLAGGAAGLAGLVAFAVSSALDTRGNPSKPR